MAAGDLYNARMQYTYLGQLLENRYFISHITGVGDAGILAGSLNQIYKPSLQAIQNIGVLYTFVVIVNLNDSTDFVTLGITGNGVRPGLAMPPFTSWGFTLFSTDTRLRSGGKRVGGLSEEDVSAGQADAGIITNLTNMAQVFQDTFQNVALTNTYVQVMHTEGNLATDQNPLTVPLREVSYRRVTTQSSRKFPS